MPVGKWVHPREVGAVVETVEDAVCGYGGMRVHRRLWW